MGNRLLVAWVLLAATGVFVSRTGCAAGSAVRKADTAWAATAGTGNVDAWLAFYGADPIVRLPHAPLLSGLVPVRDAVSRLLALPHLSLSWHPLDIQMDRSGRLAYSIDAYVERYDDPHGALVARRGRRFELWRREPGGTWKCIVDTWGLDEVGTSPPASPPASPQPARLRSDGKYGARPLEYPQAIRRYFAAHLRHPNSVRYRPLSVPSKGYMTEISGTFLMHNTRRYGWIVNATIDAENAGGHYVGFKSYAFLFRGEKIVDARLPLPGGEMR